MTDQFVAEIRVTTFNFAPTGWAFCNGQLLPISQNTALFSLLGTYYGGDGKSTFALPDLQGQIVLGPGHGPGLSERFIGESGGQASVSLLTSEMPSHGHTIRANQSDAPHRQPAPGAVLAATSPGTGYVAQGRADQVLDAQVLGMAGGGLPHPNEMPYLTLNYIIALQGIFPPRQ